MPQVKASSNIDKEIKLAPHKALYDINLSGKNNNADINNITGKMFYELKISCDAWITTQRYDMLYDFAHGHSSRTTSEFSTYESFDGKSFNFTMQRKRDGVLFEEIRGRATANNNDNLDEAIYSIPEGLSFKLSQGTFFPVKHTIAVLNKIKSGDKLFNATIFDGSDDKGPLDINSLILANAPACKLDANNLGNIDKDLLVNESWKIRLAFFPLDNFNATSDYEMSAILYENGVISNMDVDFKDFSVTHKLIALEPLEEGCLTDINKR